MSALASDLLERLRALDIKIEAQGGDLHIRGKKKALTSELAAEIKHHKPALLDLLRRNTDETLAEAQSVNKERPSEPQEIKRVDRDGDIVLAFAQEPLVLIEKVAPTGGAYNLTLSLRLEGALDLQTLRASLSELIHRHESLRTTFVEQEAQFVQKIHPKMEVDFPVVKVGPDPSILLDSIRDSMEEPFNLTTGPLIRPVLFDLSWTDEGTPEYVLIIVVHHIVSDGWSLGILRRELFVIYDAIRSGSPIPLPDLPIQYADYAAWQKEGANGERFEKSVAYWSKTLSGLEGPMPIPSDRRRLTQPTYKGASVPINLSAALSKSFVNLCRQEGASLFMGALAALHVVLHRHTGEKDLVIGTPIALRTRRETESLVGNTVNPVVLRTTVDASLTVRALIARSRDTVLHAFDHCEVPIQRIVREIRPARNASYNPIYQVMLNVAPGDEELEVADLRISPFTVRSNRAQLDLSLALFDTSEGIRGELNFNRDIFDRDTVVRLVQHFERVVEGFIDDLDCEIGRIPILSDEEQRTLLVEWNDTRTPFPDQTCLHSLFEQTAARSPEKVALIVPANESTPERSLTYRELNERANQIAQHLIGLGVASGDLVVLCVKRDLEMMTGVLGILKAGATYVPLDPNFPPSRLQYMISDSGASVLVSQADIRDRLELEAPLVVLLDRDEAVIESRDKTNPAIEQASNSIAYVIYTSGSTGKPKGVELPHRSVLNFLHSMQNEPGLSDHDRLLAVTTLSFDIAVLELFLPLVTGGQVILARSDEVVSASRLIDLVNLYEITVMQATPSTWRMMLEAGWKGSPLMKALCGGEPLPIELAHALTAGCASLWNMYGPTETTIWSTISRVRAGAEFISIGRPIENTQIFILDAALQPVPIGATGELYIAGDGLAKGYLNRPELTGERFIHHTLGGTAGDRVIRLYRTGDLARYRNNGEIECLGRVDSQIKLRGYRIELGEIESVLAKFEGVDEAAITAWSSGQDDARLVAYVRGPNSLAPDDLRQHLRAYLPDYMVPFAYTQLDQFPMTPNGKVDRKALPSPDLDSDISADATLPTTEAETLIAAIWCDLLGLKTVGVHANFFDLGGHSLLGLRVIAAINRSFQTQIQPVDFFEVATVAGLAALVSPNSEKRPTRPLFDADPHHILISDNDSDSGSEYAVRANFEAVRSALESARAHPVQNSDRPYRMRTSWIANFLLAPLFRINRRSVRAILYRMIHKLEGGGAFSRTLRKVYKEHYQMEIGDYSTGFFDVGMVKRHTRVGRYSIMTETARCETANHPGNTFSSNAFFYNSGLKFSSDLEIPRHQIEIGNDVFIGHNATILFPTKRIGDGAIVAAHAVVTEDVPPFAIVAGYPAQIVRYRFSEETIAKLLELKWWEASLEDLDPVKEEFQRPLEEKRIR